MMRSLVVCLSLLLIGAGDPATEVIVEVSAHGFDPPAIEVNRGMIVAFHRRDPGEETYRIVSADGSIESWSFEQYTQWSHRFTLPGTYELHIKEHPETAIRIHVR